VNGNAGLGSTKGFTEEVKRLALQSGVNLVGLFPPRPMTLCQRFGWLRRFRRLRKVQVLHAFLHRERHLMCMEC